jgi:membrane protease YdiL (CAAX protease family)
MDKKRLKKDIEGFLSILRDIDKKTVTIFISVAILQTISFYFTSRRFFRQYFFFDYQNYDNINLIEFLYWFVGDFLTLFILGALIIKFFHKEKLSNYGLKLGDYKSGLFYSGIFLTIMVIIIWFVSAQSGFAEKYPHLSDAKSNWNIFLVYEMGMLLYMFAWEFIWRGYMLFGLEPKFGYYSVLMQMIPFVILHNGKPFLETFGAIFGGLALGILALRTRSIYYCVVTHIGVMYSIDLISSLRYRANDFGIDLTSLLNILKQLL